PVHALRLRAEQLDALPLREGRQRRMRRAADEIDRAVAHLRVALVDREDHLELDVEPFLLEEAELDRRDGGEVRVRDDVRDGEFHFTASPSSTASSPAKAGDPVITNLGNGVLGAPLARGMTPNVLLLLHRGPLDRRIHSDVAAALVG